jgi:hypothetical protein
MSVSRSYPIRCPKCSTEFEAVLHDSINRQENPELREALLENRVNTAVCPGCAFGFRVDKDLLYHDPENRFMIYWNAAGDAGLAAAQREFQLLLSALPPGGPELPALHLVLSRIELIERIFVLESGLNPRLVEYIKHMVFTHNRAKVDPNLKRILFNAKDSTEEMLFFVVQDAASGELEQALTYSRKAYQTLSDLFDRDDRTPSLMELFPGPVVSARRLLQDPPKPGPGPAVAG